jgi:hypothetical protein
LRPVIKNPYITGSIVKNPREAGGFHFNGVDETTPFCHSPCQVQIDDKTHCQITKPQGTNNIGR